MRKGAGRPQSVLITEAYWRRQFGGDPKVIGATLTFQQRIYTIVGVIAPPFRYPARSDIYYLEQTPFSPSRSAHNNRVVGHLAAGVSLAQAQSDMRAVAARLSEQYPQSNGDKSAIAIPLQDVVVGDLRRTLLVLLAAVAFVLLIACANVANLLLARAALVVASWSSARRLAPAECV